MALLVNTVPSGLKNAPWRPSRAPSERRAPVATSWENRSPAWVKYTTPAPLVPSARCRKAAICPRVTVSSGQKRLLVGGLQPRVMPESASHSMSAPNTFEAGTSSKATAGTAIVSSRPTASNRRAIRVVKCSLGVSKAP